MRSGRITSMLAVAGLAMASLFPASARTAVDPAAKPREPKPTKRQIQKQRSEIEDWNAAVEAKQAAKKARKLSKTV
jgi:hypothetical protein